MSWRIASLCWLVELEESEVSGLLLSVCAFLLCLHEWDCRERQQVVFSFLNISSLSWRIGGVERKGLSSPPSNIPPYRVLFRSPFRTFFRAHIFPPSTRAGHKVDCDIPAGQLCSPVASRDKPLSPWDTRPPLTLIRVTSVHFPQTNHQSQIRRTT